MLFCKFIQELYNRADDNVDEEHIQIRFDVIIAVRGGDLADSQNILYGHEEGQGGPFDQVYRNIANGWQGHDHGLGNDDLAVRLEFRKANGNAGFKLSLRNTQKGRAENFCQEGDRIQGKDDDGLPELIDAVEDVEIRTHAFDEHI